MKTKLYFILALIIPPFFGSEIGCVINAQIITTVAGNGVQGFSGDGGLATNAELNYATNVTFDAIGNLYFSDELNNRIRRVSTTGIITTIAGSTSTNGYSGDGGPATLAKLYYPCGIEFNSKGNLFIADAHNHCVRMIDMASGIISTIAGTGTMGYSGDGGLATAAELSAIVDLAFDKVGNLYIADYGNYRVRKVDTLGIISTIAGNGSSGFSGDNGPAISAQIGAIEGVAIDTSDNLYIIDTGNQRIRKVNTSGIITTVVGNGIAGFSGDGGQALNAELNTPAGLTFDTAGNMYITDFANYRIRKVNASGIITTIIGNGTAGLSGDGGLATNAELAYPIGLAFSTNGNLFIADGNRVRTVTNAGQINVTTFENANDELNFYPNPASAIIIVALKTQNEIQTGNIKITNILGVVAKEMKTGNKELKIDVSDLSDGVYFLNYEIGNRKVIKKIIKN